MENLIGQDTKKLLNLFSAQTVSVSSDPYLPWDKFRYKSPPEGVTVEERWLATKLARQAVYRKLPLFSVDGKPFVYALPDEVLRAIEEISRDTSGNIGISEQVTNSATRDRYLVSSLIEEAITSSQLEGASTTRNVAKDMLRTGRPPRNRDELMILNNYSAMKKIGQLRESPLTPEMICEIHRIVTEGTLDDETSSGRFQLPEDVRVGVYAEADQLPHRPPPAKELVERVQRLCDFANGLETDGPYVPPVVRAIVTHFMIGYDHPFEDGNGRTARALFYWSMLNQGYWLTEFISVSRILKKAPSQYAKSFLYTEQDEGDLTYFIIYQLSVIQRAIKELHAYLDLKIQELRDFQQSIAMLPGEFNHRQLAVLEHAVKNPGGFYSVASHGASHNVVRETARHDLIELEKRGLLERHRVGKGHAWTPASNLAEKLKSAS